MAPKKAKKAADSINSRLALVMKSGKGATAQPILSSRNHSDHNVQSPSVTSQPWRPFDPARPSSSSSLATPPLWGSPSSSTTLCCPRPMSTTSLATTWVQQHLQEVPAKKPPQFVGPWALEGYVLIMFLQIELGTACGKLYRCSTMAILDAGDSDILTGSVS